ncbi:dihydrodipicolinate synthase family protein [Ensifer adhaerens]|uniref:dihydrodipicolinate synthase family protein n=1 Tax=Ensifer adhaerens TaxID=106592 RepID=UPI001CC101DF|nr:dihydrodipicolinate synthase family protein [Ensifer adhaerens]MBZ7923717.1 dihydrodipicolinate synthase family protein [Ensifer adhaerens]UAX92267.1 dihydrodipicolinate synthase family protein [Ensifer adhaerens]UAX99899.1 dihydrodipicolinate synthase family protein [Ensifer adhaerens]UAY07283.1 dihydrodipicolinate synthase family protein [Ensifer adhaerens]
MTSLTLPRQDGSLEQHRLTGTPIERPGTPPTFNRIAYAAAHVVSDPFRDLDPWGNPAIDWDATMAFRHHLWGLGFKIAEAMDTAQRGMGLPWAGAQQLIRRSLAEARQVPGADLACGAGTDHLAPADVRSLDDVIAAYEEQVGFVEGEGGRTIMMASRALARVARSADDYRHVYGRILGQARHKVVLHWLGDMFDPQLRRYWGSENFEQALDTVLSIIEANRDKVEGIKISLLDNAKEVALRNRLPEGVLCFTGDDFNYAELIEGDGTKYSHALLGIFDAVAPSASKALAALAKGDLATFRGVIEPTVPLSRKIFEAPTQYYKAGVVLLAWLNGHQRHFTMPAGMQSARGVLHYSDIFRLADRANVLDRPELAAERMKSLLSTLGVDQSA